MFCQRWIWLRNMECRRGTAEQSSLAVEGSLNSSLKGTIQLHKYIKTFSREEFYKERMC